MPPYYESTKTYSTNPTTVNLTFLLMLFRIFIILLPFLIIFSHSVQFSGQYEPSKQFEILKAISMQGIYVNLPFEGFLKFLFAFKSHFTIFTGYIVILLLLLFCDVAFQPLVVDCFKVTKFTF